MAFRKPAAFTLKNSSVGIVVTLVVLNNVLRMHFLGLLGVFWGEFFYNMVEQIIYKYLKLTCNFYFVWI